MIMENSRDEEKLQINIERVAECLKKEHIEDIRMFSYWFSRMFQYRGSEKSIDIPEKGGGSQMLAETAQKLTQKWLKQGIEQEKHEVLIRMLILKFGLSDDEKVLIRNIQEPWRLDSALDAFATGEDKQTLLARLS
jgi:hypothetical protein